MDTDTTRTRLERWQQRLNQSRYWTISLAIHAVLIAVLSTLIIIHREPSIDFVVSGGVPVDLPPELQSTSEDDQRPADFDTGQSPRPEMPSVEASAGGDVLTLAANKVQLLPTRGREIVVNAPDPIVQIRLPRSDVPGMLAHRFGHDSRGRLLTRSRGGGPKPTMETENAVLRGLDWLREHQNADGSWGERNQGAMTGLALLCFLGHGELGDSPNYGFTVNKALDWVVANGTKHQGRLSMTGEDWGPGNGGVYEHGILTYALAEYYTLTKDERVIELLRQAVGHIVAGQGPDGGWMYHYDKTQGDTSVTGWQVQALKAAHLSKLGLAGVEGALDHAMKHFDRVQGSNGGYGYRTPGDRYSLTGVGVLCEYFWREKRDGDLRRSVEFIEAKTAAECPLEYQHPSADLYAWYYHTQALLMFGGGAWAKWEAQIRPALVKAQASDGSWPVMRAAGHGNLQNDARLTGAVYRTTLSVLALESYYRYLPLNQASQAPAGMHLARR